MNNKTFLRTLMIIAVPIMIQSLITASVNLIDTLMIGRLGEKAIASLGITNQYFMLFSLLALGIYTGVGVIISQYYGKGDTSRITRLAAVQIRLGVMLAGLFVFAALALPQQIMNLFSSDPEVVNLGASYLRLVCIGYVPFALSAGYSVASRSIGKTVVPMVASMVALVVNVGLNYTLIYGHFGMPALGVRGAAIATAIARLIEMIVVFIFIYSSCPELKISSKELFSHDKAMFRQILGPTSQVVLNDLCWGLGMIIYAMIYGRIGTGALASIQIMTTVQNLFMIVVIAISSAACVMIGNKIGTGAYDTAKEEARYFVKIVLALTVLLGLMVAGASSFILSFFELSHDLYQTARHLLFITAAIMPIRGLGILFIIGILRGGGDAKGALGIELFTMWLMGVPLCFVGAVLLNLDVEIVYGLVLSEEIAKLILSIHRFNKGNWIKDYTRYSDAPETV